MIMQRRYIALFDILGFKQIVERNLLDRVVKAFASFIIGTSMARKFVTDVYEQAEISYRIFSDTILVYSEKDTKEALLNMVRFCQLMVSMMFADGILLRGAITKGDVFISEENGVFVGKPIVRAYLMEQDQEWVGCWIDDQCIEAINAEYLVRLMNDDIVEYEVPLKSGDVKRRLALNWTYGFNIPINSKQFDTKIESKFRKYSGRKEFSSDVKRKIDHTKSFIRYAFPLTATAKKR